MNAASPAPDKDLGRSLVTVDVGNTRLKLGVFELPLARPLPHPRATISIGHDWEPAEIDAFLSEPPAAYAWAIVSVNKPARERLVEWLAEHGVQSIRRSIAASCRSWSKSSSRTRSAPTGW